MEDEIDNVEEMAESIVVYSFVCGMACAVQARASG